MRRMLPNGLFRMPTMRKKVIMACIVLKGADRSHGPGATAARSVGSLLLELEFTESTDMRWAECSNEAAVQVLHSGHLNQQTAQRVMHDLWASNMPALRRIV